MTNKAILRHPGDVGYTRLEKRAYSLYNHLQCLGPVDPPVHDRVLISNVGQCSPTMSNAPSAPDSVHVKGDPGWKHWPIRYQFLGGTIVQAWVKAKEISPQNMAKNMVQGS